MSKRDRKEKILFYTLLLIAVILMVFAIFVEKKSDRRAPVITIDSELLSECDLNNSDEVLSAVSATDDKSDYVEIFVAGIRKYDGGLFEVTYTARDKAGNVAVKSAVVKNNTVLELTEEEKLEAEKKKAEEERKAAQQQSREAEETKPTKEKPTLEEGAPIITLKSGRGEINVGEKFNCLNYIESITDDKDSKEDLYKRIIVSGYYSIKKPGSYRLNIYVTDLDGHKSNKAIFTLTVKAAE